jgi:PTH1 family peptidyl-tRNA hydrolase
VAGNPATTQGVGSEVESDSPGALVLGLGNPGETYRSTRHNLGFWVVEELMRRAGAPQTDEYCGALVARSEIAGGVALARPQTFMNRSGFAARCLVERFALPADRILVVYDDIALPLGKLRLRPEGGPGGHRGMESVIENLRTPEVARLRLGIAPDPTEPQPTDLAEFVLAPFATSELDPVRALVDRAADAVLLWIENGTEASMSRVNG